MSNYATNPKYLERLQQFTLMDDTFARKVFEDNIPAAELLLHIILKNDKLKVLEVLTQKELKNLLGHSSILDVLATDDTGKRYNIEIQREDAGAIPKRARYYSSLIDANTLEEGENYSKLPETYIIFITENDVLKGNQQLYEFIRTEKASGECFNDESHIIYLNSSIHDDTALGRLMSDFYKRNPREMYYKTLAQKALYFKESRKGVAKMCKIMEELKEEGRAEGTALYMMEENQPLQKIMNRTKFDKQTLIELAKKENIPYKFA